MDLFSSQTAVGQSLVLEVKGIVVPFKVKNQKTGKIETHLLRGIPSFKTQKTAIGWMNPATKKIEARPMTLPQHKKWMELAILSIESQLRSVFGITDQKIRTVASPRSWIASLVPLNDSWTWYPEQITTSRLCREGEEEGATITITRLK